LLLLAVVATCTVPNLVVLPGSKDFTFPMVSPFIVLQHVEPIFDVPLWHIFSFHVATVGHQ
jgi:tellurite resistance protein TehA-like permease